MEFTNETLEALRKGHREITTCDACGSHFISEVSTSCDIDEERDMWVYTTWHTPCPNCHAEKRESIDNV